MNKLKTFSSIQTNQNKLRTFSSLKTTQKNLPKEKLDFIPFCDPSEDENKSVTTQNERNKKQNDDLIYMLLEQNYNKYNKEIEIYEQAIDVIRNQNRALKRKKKQIIKFFESQTFLQKKLSDLNNLLQYKIKKEKELKLYKLNCFLQNISHMIMINPNLLDDPQTLLLIQQTRQDVEKLKNNLQKMKKHIAQGNDDSFDEMNFSTFSRKSEVELLKGIKNQIKEQKIQEQEKVEIEIEKQRIEENMKHNQQQLKIPDGMFLISKQQYNNQLDEVKDKIEDMMQKKFQFMLKEELERIENERLRKLEQEQKMKRVKIKVRAHYWKQVLPLILLNVSRNQAKINKIKIMKLYTDTLPQIRDISFSIMKNIIIKNCQEIWQEDISCNVIQEQNILFFYKEKPPSEKEIDKSAAILEQYCRKILTGMIEICTEEIMGKNLIDFFLQITYDGSYLPQNFFTEYELDRLQFDSNGKLIQMNEDRRKMLITFYLVFYVFINRVLTKPWQFDHSFQETIKKRLFLRTIGSVIYHFFMNVVNKQVQFIGETQEHIKIENRVNYRQPTQLFLDERSPRENIYDKEQIFGDAFTKIQLKTVFLDKIAQFERIQVLVQSFLDKIHVILNRNYELEQIAKQKDKSQRMVREKINTCKFLNRIKIQYVTKNQIQDLQQKIKTSI